ncbi:hypothetical protein TNCV_3209851 [Trichonephila clavipes]|nr:hypothetical protein TNCV_3209851 [Trichonephila clavipes]
MNIVGLLMKPVRSLYPNCPGCELTITIVTPETCVPVLILRRYRINGLIYKISVQFQSPHVDVVGEYDDGGPSSGVVLVIRPRLKNMRTVTKNYRIAPKCAFDEH